MNSETKNITASTPNANNKEGIEVAIKWGKETIELLLIPIDGVKAFKVQIQQKTGIPINRIKLFPKSKGECYSLCNLSCSYHFVPKL